MPLCIDGVKIPAREVRLQRTPFSVLHQFGDLSWPARENCFGTDYLPVEAQFLAADHLDLEMGKYPMVILAPSSKLLAMSPPALRPAASRVSPNLPLALGRLGFWAETLTEMCCYGSDMGTD